MKTMLVKYYDKGSKLIVTQFVPQSCFLSVNWKTPGNQTSVTVSSFKIISLY